MGKAGGKSRNDPAAVINILYSFFISLTSNVDIINNMAKAQWAEGNRFTGVSTLYIIFIIHVEILSTTSGSLVIVVGNSINIIPSNNAYIRHVTMYLSNTFLLYFNISNGIKNSNKYHKT